jgi:ubiquinone/menaquinone biosynthesis C-methylase UbiE
LLAFKIETMLKKTGKKIIAILLRILLLDFFLSVFSRVTYFIAKLIYLRDWGFRLHGYPQFFNHRLNLSFWPSEPSRWSFTARGVYAREHMVSNSKVLDLCCGDGSYSFLFFADIAAQIDAIDNDPSALAYARRYNKHPKINYCKTDIIKESFPSSGYDVIVWNAGICYFSKDHILLILTKITNSGNESMVLCGMLPKANGHEDHITEFSDMGAIKELLDLFFNHVVVKELTENAADTKSATFYFTAKEPKKEKLSAKA